MWLVQNKVINEPEIFCCDTYLDLIFRDYNHGCMCANMKVPNLFPSLT